MSEITNANVQNENYSILELEEIITKAENIECLSRTLREALDNGCNVATDYVGTACILTERIGSLANDLCALSTKAKV